MAIHRRLDSFSLIFYLLLILWVKTELHQSLPPITSGFQLLRSLSANKYFCWTSRAVETLYLSWFFLVDPIISLAFNSWNKFLSDSIIFNFIVILCTTHVMTRSVVTGNLTSISCHSGAQFFYNNLYPALTGQSFLSEHGHCKSIFHNVLQPILSPLLLYIYLHIHMDGISLSFAAYTRLSVFLCCRIQLPQQSMLFSIFRLFSYISLSRQVHSTKSVASFTTFHWRIFIRHTLFSLHQSVNLLSRPVFLHPFPKFSYPTVFVIIIQANPSFLFQSAQ